jgi:hypothetical protein
MVDHDHESEVVQSSTHASLVIVTVSIRGAQLSHSQTSSISSRINVSRRALIANSPMIVVLSDQISTAWFSSNPEISY